MAQVPRICLRLQHGLHKHSQILPDYNEAYFDKLVRTKYVKAMATGVVRCVVGTILDLSDSTQSRISVVGALGTICPPTAPQDTSWVMDSTKYLLRYVLESKWVAQANPLLQFFH